MRAGRPKKQGICHAGHHVIVSINEYGSDFIDQPMFGFFSTSHLSIKSLPLSFVRQKDRTVPYTEGLYLDGY